MKIQFILFLIIFSLKLSEAQVTVSDSNGKEFTLNYTKPFFASKYITWGFAPLFDLELTVGKNYSDALSFAVFTGFIEYHTSGSFVFGCSPRLNPSTLIFSDMNLKKRLNTELELYARLPLLVKPKISFRRLKIIEYANMYTNIYKVKHAPTNLTNIVGLSGGYDFFYAPIGISNPEAPAAYKFNAIKAGIYLERDWWVEVSGNSTRHHVSRVFASALYSPKVTYTYIINQGHFDYITADSLVNNKPGFEMGISFMPVRTKAGCNFRVTFQGCIIQRRHP